MKRFTFFAALLLLVFAVNCAAEAANQPQPTPPEAKKWETLPAARALTNYTPLKPAFKALTAGKKLLPHDFIKYGTKCWLNGLESAGSEKNFAWSKIEGGAHCLMILVDTLSGKGANKNLFIPQYGLPAISKMRSDIYITWTNPSDPNDTIELALPIGSKEMQVIKNSLKGINKNYKVKLPVGAYDSDGKGALYYVPLYAILNEVDGGVMFDPLGDGVAFIYTGSALQGYSGVWEVSDSSEYRLDVNMGGKIVSVANYWWSLELRPDGTFTEIDRHYKDNNTWYRTEYKGRYAFFGRILAMKYTSESLYTGDFNNLSTVKADAPFEGKWGIPGDVYVEYVDNWDRAEVLNIRGSRTLYSKELSGRQW